MKALTVWQPHAILLATGMRCIETRSWPTRYRGPLLIHCAKKWNADICETSRLATNDARAGRMELKAGLHLAQLTNRELLGCGLALAEVYDCRPIPDFKSAPESTWGDRKYGGWGEGRFGWFLRDLQPLPNPLPITGAQGLWDVTAEQQEQLKASLAAAKP